MESGSRQIQMYDSDLNVRPSVITQSKKDVTNKLKSARPAYKKSTRKKEVIVKTTSFFGEGEWA